MLFQDEKSQKECIPVRGNVDHTETVESSVEGRRLSLNAYRTNVKFESNASQRKNRRSSAPNHFHFDIDVKSTSYLTKASNTKEKRINIFNK